MNRIVNFLWRGAIISYFLALLPLNAQVTYEAINSGDWSNATTWNGGNIPPTTNCGYALTILLQGADKNINLNGSISITDGYAYNFMVNSGLLEIYGNVYINGPCNLTVQGTGNIKIYGDLILNGATVTISKPLEVFGNVNIQGTGSVNVNGGPFIVHGNYTSSSQTQITPDAVFAVAGTFEGLLVSYNGNGNLYVGSGSYNLLPPVPPQAVCDENYNGPNIYSHCPVGNFLDLANREPAIYQTYFGSSSLNLYQLTSVINCNTATLTLSGSDVGVNYELYRNGVYANNTLSGTGNTLQFNVNTEGNYMVRAVNGSLWRFMSGVAVITLGTIPVITSTNGGRCGPGQVTLLATASPSTSVIYWYTQLSGGAPVGSGTNFLTPNLTATTYYYVEAQSPPNCVSPRQQVVATIYEIPATNPITHD